MPEKDPTVMCSITPKDLQESYILQYQGMKMLPDNVAPADCAEFMANIYEGILQK